MKKFIALMIALAVTAAAVPAEAGLGIKIKGGYTWISYGDFNDWVDAANNEIPPGYETVDKIHWIPEVSAELTFPLLPDFSGSIGIGYLSGKSDYNFSALNQSFSNIHKVKSIPIIANVYWEPPLEFINPFVYGGVGLYRTSVEFDQKFDDGSNYASYFAELDKWGFGLQAGGGIRIAIVPTISFDIGVQGRWVSISGFEGEATDQDGVKEEVYLANHDNGDITIYGPMPKGSGDPEATVDLSGYTIFIGMTFGF